MEEKRPDPETLLRQMEQDQENVTAVNQKGRLKVFLGYCAGVGKTYRMLQEAATNKKNGTDVVIAVAETHGRKETEALLSGLETLPRKKVAYSGIVLEEMDIDALLARSPAIAVVDELAHTNAPGSRHLKRYQDVEELLNAGVNVLTTLNVQHIESLVDIVQQTSGVKMAETIPDRILALADEIELVDLTPEKLIERLKDGKVYIPKKAELAMRQFFKKGNLLALRELSLDYTAKQVDDDVRDYMLKHAVAGPWPVGARLMTGISSSPTSQKLLRFTHRMAQDLDAEWFAVFVESPQQIEMNEKARAQLDKNIRLAEELGAMVVLLKGNDVAEEMIGFARTKSVTLIVAGPSRRSWYEKTTRGSILDALIKKSGPINLLITGNERTGRKESGGEYRYIQPAHVRHYLICTAVLAGTVGLGLLLRPQFEPVNIAMLLLVPTITCGIVGGIRVGLFASLLAVGAFNFFFIPPYLTFRVADLRYLPSFAVFFLVSFITSFLARSLRQESESSMHRERFVYSLYSFTRAIMAARDLDDILQRAVKSISEAFDSNVVILLPDSSGKPKVSARDDDAATLTTAEEAVAVWVYSNGQPAGKNTHTLSSTAWLYLPLKVQDSIVGAIGLRKKDAGALTPEQEQLFESFAGVVALAVAKATK